MENSTEKILTGIRIAVATLTFLVICLYLFATTNHILYGLLFALTMTCGGIGFVDLGLGRDAHIVVWVPFTLGLVCLILVPTLQMAGPAL